MRIKLITTTKLIEVFYDGHCGICSSFMEWLVAQERAFEVICLAYQSEDTLERFPELNEHDPAKEIIVRVDGEDVYQGAEGWVWCLWSCVKYRDVAKLVNSRLLLPMAKKVCYLVSKKRLNLSKLVFRKKTQDLATEIHKIEVKPTCAKDNCIL